MTRFRKAKWQIAICLLVLILTSTTVKVWASPASQSEFTPSQVQAVKAAVNLLLMEDQNELYWIYLPTVQNFRICVGCKAEQAESFE